jgi:hypothetical protein
MPKRGRRLRIETGRNSLKKQGFAGNVGWRHTIGMVIA